MENSLKYPSFTVLMSVYKNDRPEYLDTALQSIEFQTVKPTEFIVVEDGPISKQLKEVIFKYKNKFTNFKDIVLKENKGLGEALRIGTRYVSTDWIARMDADDFSLPDRFEKQLSLINRNPELAIIGGQVNEFSGNINNIVGQRVVPQSKHEIYDFVKWRSPFNHPTVIINKKVLVKVGGYKKFGNLEDYYLWARIIAGKYDVVNLSDFLTLMRVDDGLYARRGNITNIKYFYKLRKYLYNEKLVTLMQRIEGNIIVTVNIFLPSWFREKIYKMILHKL